MDDKLSLLEHLDELRTRIIICLIVVLLGFVLSLAFVEKILTLLTAPVGQLVFLRPTEAFFVRIKLAFFSGLFFSTPVILYQAWRFMSPALLSSERRYFYAALPFSYLLCSGGMAFAYFAVLPVGIRYLLSYETPTLQPMISAGSYISFVAIFLFSFGLFFQLPLVVLLLTKTGIVTPQFLKKNRKYAILGVFILAGVLTPGPDIFSQLMMALPALLLYEIGILLSRWSGVPRRSPEV